MGSRDVDLQGQSNDLCRFGCDVVALTQYCKLTTFLYFILPYIGADSADSTITGVAITYIGINHVNKPSLYPVDDHSIPDKPHQNHRLQNPSLDWFLPLSVVQQQATYNLQHYATIIFVLYSMPAAGKLSVGDSVPAAAKLA